MYKLNPSKEWYEQAVKNEDYMENNMTDIKIYRDALTKAFNNGWIWNKHNIKSIPDPYREDMEDDPLYRDLVDELFCISEICTPAFAKAFFGEEIVWSGKMLTDPDDASDIYVKEMIPIWQYHLQQMVILDNPLRYLEKFL